jgi:hypothetical protein
MCNQRTYAKSARVKINAASIYALPRNCSVARPVDASQRISCVECTQRAFDSRPDSNDPVFNARPKKRDP